MLKTRGPLLKIILPILGREGRKKRRERVLARGRHENLAGWAGRDNTGRLVRPDPSMDQGRQGFPGTGVVDSASLQQSSFALPTTINPNAADTPSGSHYPVPGGPPPDLNQMFHMFMTMNQSIASLTAAHQQTRIRMEEMSANQSPPGYGRTQGQNEVTPPLNLEQPNRTHPGHDVLPNDQQTLLQDPLGFQNQERQLLVNQRVPPPPPSIVASQPEIQQPPWTLTAPPAYGNQPDPVATWLHQGPPEHAPQYPPHPWQQYHPGYNLQQAQIEVPFAPQNYQDQPRYPQSMAGNVSPQEEVNKENEEITKLKEQMQSIHKKLAEGTNDESELQYYSLYPEAKLPPDFKMPSIGKFDGRSLPKLHLRSYVLSMQVKGCKEPEMAQCFHLSLTGSAQKWFLGLERHRIRTWVDIMKEFNEQYKTNEELEVTRKHLEMTKQGEKESFSDFITRWREMAAQVVDRPKEEDLIEIVKKNFTSAVQASMGKHYIPHFKALLSLGSQVEEELAKKAETESKRSNSQYTTKKASTSAINQINTYPPNPYTQNFVYPSHSPYPQNPSHFYQQSSYQTRPNSIATNSFTPNPKPPMNPNNRSYRPPPREFSQLPGTLSRTFEELKAAGALRPLNPKPVSNPPPPWWNMNEMCLYHQTPGHDTDGCAALRHAIQDLIDTKAISPPGGPNVANNPLPNHGPRARINAVDTGGDLPDPVNLIKPIQKSRHEHVMLCKARASSNSKDCKDKIEEAMEGFSLNPTGLITQITRAPIYNHVIHRWMKEMNLIPGLGLGKYNQGIPSPLLLETNPGKIGLGYTRECMKQRRFKPLTLPKKSWGENSICMITPITFDWSKTTESPSEQKSPKSIQPVKPPQQSEQSSEPQDTAAAWVQHLTRSGRVYQPPPIEASGAIEKGVAITGEDRVIEQLKKTQAQITIWGLLVASRPHKEALMRLLDESVVPLEASPAQVVEMVGSLSIQRGLSFSDADLSPLGKDHNLALHITVEAREKVVPQVLIDNGSTINVCPLKTAKALGIEESELTSSSVTVRAYDNTRRDVLGSIILELLVGLAVFSVEFQVIDIPSSFNLLLGRAWLHEIGALPSSLHQKLKIPYGREVITIPGDPERIITPKESPVLKIGSQDVHLTGFTFEPRVQALTTQTIKYLPPDSMPFLNEKVVCMLRAMKYMPGLCLGNGQQGLLQAIEVEEKKKGTGLGYVCSELEDESSEGIKAITISRSSLNGFFVKEGEDFPYCGFQEPWYNSKGKRTPGWEVFYEDDLYVKAEVLHSFPIQCKISQVFEEEEEEMGDLIGNLFEVMALEEEGDLYDPVHLIRPVPSTVNRKGSRSGTKQMIDLLENVLKSINEESASQYVHMCECMIAGLEIECMNDLPEESHQRIQSAEGDTILVNLGSEDDKKEVKIGANLNEREKAEFHHLLREYVDVFAWSYADMPGLSTDIVMHEIHTKPEIHPVKQKLRKLIPEWSLKVKEEVEKQLKVGFIRVVEYPTWLANIVPVPKPNGKVRMCVDYRDLNRACPKDDFPLPNIDIIVDNTANHALKSFVDGFAGYNQIKMHPEHQEKTAFITPWGTYCYTVMPFGLKNAGATYQRAATTIFHDMIHREVEVYVDDMIIKSREREDHIPALQVFFDRLRKFQMRLNPQKCTFGVTKGKLLGYIVSQRGIEVDPAKIKAIQEMPEPRTEKEVRGFLGKLQFISRFISQLTQTCEPIFKLLQKSSTGEWNQQCHDAFNKIKEYLSNPPILAPPQHGLPLLLYLTVTENSAGAMLAQHLVESRKEQAIYYISKKLSPFELNYTPLEKSCTALVWATRKLRHYMIAFSVILISRNDPLKYLFEKPVLSNRMAKWVFMLSEFDITYMTQKSVKGQIIADFLAGNPIFEEATEEIEFPDEAIMNVKIEEDWKLYFDGAANRNGNGIGILLIEPDQTHSPLSFRLDFECTNNMAEYEACIAGLEIALQKGVKKIQVFGDSALIIYQILRRWKIKEEKLIPYLDHLEEVCEKFERVEFFYIPRTQNNFADALATLASMVEIPEDMEEIQLSIREKTGPAYCLSIEARPQEEEIDPSTWYYDIWNLLKECRYPEGTDKRTRTALRRLASRFIICADRLYRRNYDGIHLQCLKEDQFQSMMDRVHGGECGPHMSGHTLARKIIRQGYYWSTIQQDCNNHVRRCHKCQIYAKSQKLPPLELYNMTAPWPFSTWGIDVIGKVSPKASNGHEYILVAIDYFTKWVEAESYKVLNANKVAQFIKKNIICRYGVPHEIISDNGTHFEGAANATMEEYGITRHRSSPYRPQTNGAVEAANKNLKSILSKMTGTGRDWAEKLPYALWGYRTTERVSTGATPFSLTYGMEAVLPIELEIPSLRVLLESQINEIDWVKARYVELALLDEKRLRAAYHHQGYQKRVARAFNRKVKSRDIQEGDIVLKEIREPARDPRGKFGQKWTGPYIIKEIHSGGAALLTDLDGQLLHSPVNLDRLKKYYQ